MDRGRSDEDRAGGRAVNAGDQVGEGGLAAASGAELPAVEVDIIFRRLVMRGLAGELGLRPDAG